MSSEDPLAAVAMAVGRSVREVLEHEWLPMIERILSSDAMVSWATAGLHPFARAAVLGMARAFEAAARGSATDDALVVLVSRFDDLDTDGDGELSPDEVRAGAHGADDEISAACSYLLDRPLALVNVAPATERFCSDGSIGRTRSVTPAAASPTTRSTPSASTKARSTVGLPADPARLARPVRPAGRRRRQDTAVHPPRPPSSPGMGWVVIALYIPTPPQDFRGSTSSRATATPEARTAQPTGRGHSKIASSADS